MDRVESHMLPDRLAEGSGDTAVGALPPSRWAAVFEASPLAQVVWDTEFRVVAWSRRAHEVFGWSAAEIQGRNFFEFLLPPNEIRRVETVARELILSRQHNSAVNRNLTKEGRTILCEWNNAPWLGPHGEVLGGVSVALDLERYQRLTHDARRFALRNETLLRACADAFYVTDLTGLILEVNAAAGAMLGHTEAELLGRRLEKFDAQRSPEELRQRLANAPREGQQVFETAHRRKDGTLVEVELRVSHVRWDEQHLLCVFAHAVTRRKAAERAVRRIEDVYRRAIAAARAVVYVRDHGADAFTYIGEGIRDLTGYAPAEFTSEQWDRLIELSAVRGPAARYGYDEAIARVRRGEVRTWECEYRLRTRTGEVRWVTDHAVELRDEGGQSQGSIGILVDITERKLAEEATRASEERFRLVVEGSPVGMLFYRLEAGDRLVLTGANPAADRILGVKLASQVGQTIEAAFPGLEGGPVPGHYRTVARTGEPWHSEEVAYRDPRIAGVFEVHAFRLAPDQVGVLFQDVTERQRVQTQLQQQARLLDLASDAILVCDLAGRIEYWNRGAETLYGVSAAEAAGQNLAAVFATRPGELEAARTAAQDRGEWAGPLHLATRDGRPLVVQSRWTLVRPSGGQPARLLVINSDETRRREMEARLVRTQRLESTGTLAGGIAHDLNNLLSPLVLSVPLLQNQALDEDGRSIVATLEENTRRAAEIIRQLLTFARGLEGQLSVLGLAPLVRELVGLLRETSPPTLRIETHLADPLWPVEASAAHVHQVLLNLCLNARDAMPQGGSIEIRAANVVLDAPGAAAHAEARPGSYVALSVRDTGTGIPSALTERIFEPFFTTKPVGAGTGLGLSTALGIVRGLGGFITLATQVGQGSSFTVWLPALPEAAVRPEAPLGRGETVLVLAADDAARERAEEALAAAGFRPRPVASATQALGLLASREFEVQVVLVDLEVAAADLLACLRTGRRLAPGAAWVVLRAPASRAVDDGLRPQLQALGVHAVLQRPVVATVLAKAVADAAARVGGPASGR